ncbi:hypothetical protein K437DRAFT_274925 [Tilletiaria anomala UBC 951]|uniref:Uncharacterized protein n=1 Tax=Tilletiaria anomala (strain ATCC 24038 / CBS 436.72 / UBC 951) TaxID=1037660 RepID=A0A066VSR1_TILAU|nr:uncharacterized protein K437DRAFT_274925 [Tilletiaria anomala UBC 951]KDN43313.1 hypothetical protein K437DRAFT_274925 [Tilletiaria anomala UBC 951]
MLVSTPTFGPTDVVPSAISSSLSPSPLASAPTFAATLPQPACAHAAQARALAQLSTRLLTTTLHHALYAKAQLSSPVALLQRERERERERGSQRGWQGDDGEQENTHGARKKWSSAPTGPASRAASIRRGNSKAKGKKDQLLDTLEALSDALHSALSLASAPVPGSAQPMTREMDLLLLFGPVLSIPKHLFLIRLLLPITAAEQEAAPASHADDGTDTEGAATVRMQAQQTERQIAMLERKLVRFLMLHDRPDEPDSGSDSDGGSGCCDDEAPQVEAKQKAASTEPLRLAHAGACVSAVKRAQARPRPAPRAMKCHVLLRADADIAHGLARRRRARWTLRRGFTTRGLAQLLGEAEQRQNNGQVEHDTQAQTRALVSSLAAAPSSVPPASTRPPRDLSGRAHFTARVQQEQPGCASAPPSLSGGAHGDVVASQQARNRLQLPVRAATAGARAASRVKGAMRAGPVAGRMVLDVRGAAGLQEQEQEQEQENGRRTGSEGEGGRASHQTPLWFLFDTPLLGGVA